MADGQRAVESIPGVTFFFPKDWLAGALYASVWPMSVGEMGGAVDALLAVEQKGKGKAEEPEKKKPTLSEIQRREVQRMREMGGAVDALLAVEQKEKAEEP
jgi:hypothetical protein